jgi:penicillin-binding protein 2
MAVMGLKSDPQLWKKHMPQPCTGSYYFGNRAWRCWEPGGHGYLDLAGAIAKSCDVYFYQLGLQLTLERMSVGGVDLGFASRTGIDLPGESKPRWPDRIPEYMDEKYGKGKWNRGLTLNLSIGQGENSQTILNMARFYAALASDGSEPEIHVAQVPVQRKKVIDLPPDQLADLRAAMLGVTQAGGTAASAALRGVALAGKTGTAQSGRKVNGVELNHAWFAGMAPADDPKIVVVVMLEFGGHGTRAARIASAIIGHYLHVKSLWDLGDQG